MKKRMPQIPRNPVDIILGTDKEADFKILNILAEAPIVIRREPSVGLVMMTVADGAGLDFHLGEVLATEAECEYEGCVGYAMIVGNQPEKALARAGAAAVFESADTAVKTRLRKFLLKQDALIKKKNHITEALHASTIVNFEGMKQW